jgi:23S rRNA (uridine2552-2'-O)-methyltransferase
MPKVKSTSAKKHRSNPEWLRRHVTDPYVQQAVAKGYRSRAAFKLSEIDDKLRLLRPGAVVVDLGSTPGSWTQIVRERLLDKDRNLRGKIIALDILPMDPLPDVVFIQGDIREEAVEAELAAALQGGKVDLVLSDMAPNLSGIAAADAARSAHLAEIAIEFALQHLKPNGAVLLKAFQGSGFSQLVEQLKRGFVTVSTRKPAASRAESAETYLLAQGLKEGGGRVDPQR